MTSYRSCIGHNIPVLCDNCYMESLTVTALTYFALFIAVFAEMRCRRPQHGTRYVNFLNIELLISGQFHIFSDGHRERTQCCDDSNVMLSYGEQRQRAELLPHIHN